jgi:ATP-dependent exoDNAse (exonuclease V) alpha subunit
MPLPSTTSHPDREVIAGAVERVTFHNAENGFCVLRIKARGHRDLVAVVGHAAVISAGEWITAADEWVNDRTHGQQFKARFLRTSAPSSLEGIEKYLASGMIRGIGPVYGKKMVKVFGEKVFDIIGRNPIACASSTASGRFVPGGSLRPGQSRRSCPRSWSSSTDLASPEHALTGFGTAAGEWAVNLDINDSTDTLHGHQQMPRSTLVTKSET